MFSVYSVLYFFALYLLKNIYMKHVCYEFTHAIASLFGSLDVATIWIFLRTVLKIISGFVYYKKNVCQQNRGIWNVLTGPSHINTILCIKPELRSLWNLIISQLFVYSSESRPIERGACGRAVFNKWSFFCIHPCQMLTHL